MAWYSKDFGGRKLVDTGRGFGSSVGATEQLVAKWVRRGLPTRTWGPYRVVLVREARAWLREHGLGPYRPVRGDTEDS